MTVAARKSARRRAARPATKSVVYDGRLLCGMIAPKSGGMFAARLATGKLLGRFANERLAQRALTAASRGERAPQPQNATSAFAWKPGEVVVGQPKDARSLGRRARTPMPQGENSGIQP